MSWLRSAINRAAEVGGKNIGPNFSRTVRNVAQHAGHAVAGGAKLVQDRLVGRNLNSFKIAVRRLDEVAQNARGVDRVQALARWLAALKEIERVSKITLTSEEARTTGGEDASVLSNDELPSPRTPPKVLSPDELPSPRTASKVLFYDLDSGGEPMNFREVFLRSHAVENIVTSMILEGPADEEVSLLLEIFGLCLAGGKELHIAIISSIQDLAKAFSICAEEVMTKKEDLLQYVRDAVSGLKLNAEEERLDADIVTLTQLIAEKQGTAFIKADVSSLQFPIGTAQGASGEFALLLTEGSGKTKELIQLNVQLRDLLQRKKLLFYEGDTQATRTEKVELLKTIMGSLQKASLEAENQISENRKQKEAALQYRVAKAQEVNEVEKGVAAEVKLLEQKRDELETQLKEVRAALAAATGRHINLQEEKEQFDEASTRVVAHLAIQEEGLKTSIQNQNAEAGVLGTWIGFLEDTWQLQASCVQRKEKDVSDALNGLEDQFLHTVVMNLSYRQEELNLLVKQLNVFSEELKAIESGRAQNTDLEIVDKDANFTSGKKRMQEKYLEAEGQVVSLLQAVEILKEEVQSFRSINMGSNSDLEKKVMDAFSSIEQMRKEVEALQRPNLEIDIPKPKISQASSKVKQSLRWADPVEHSIQERRPLEVSDEEGFSEKALEEEMQRKDINEVKNPETSPQEDTEGWEFDELEEELKREGLS